jgi:hypothetical protein
MPRPRLQRPAQSAASREVGLGFRQLALHHPRDAAIAESVSQTRIELQRLIEIRNRSW